MALKPIACLCFFVKELKHDHFLDKKHKQEQPIWKLAGHPGHPGHPGHTIAIGSGSDHQFTRAGRRIA